MYGVVEIKKNVVQHVAAYAIAACRSTTAVISKAE